MGGKGRSAGARGSLIVLLLLINGSLIAGILHEVTREAGTQFANGQSMMHGERSQLGVIDGGDLILVDPLEDDTELHTYYTGLATGYERFGDYGDVVVYDRPEADVLIAHRLVFYVYLNFSGPVVTADIPELDLWNVRNLTLVDYGYGAQEVFIDFAYMYAKMVYVKEVETEGYVTKGDHLNRTDQMGQISLVPRDDIVGVVTGLRDNVWDFMVMVSFLLLNLIVFSLWFRKKKVEGDYGDGGKEGDDGGAEEVGSKGGDGGKEEGGGGGEEEGGDGETEGHHEDLTVRAYPPDLDLVAPLLLTGGLIGKDAMVMFRTDVLEEGARNSLLLWSLLFGAAALAFIWLVGKRYCGHKPMDRFALTWSMFIPLYFVFNLTPDIFAYSLAGVLLALGLFHLAPRFSLAGWERGKDQSFFTVWLSLVGFSLMLFVFTLLFSIPFILFLVLGAGAGNALILGAVKDGQGGSEER
jgi:hypothetical protein